MSDPFLHIDGLEAGYGRQQVLRGLSMDVPRGSLATVIGPNGHGKTTTLRCVSGLVPAWGGRITFDGQDITHRKAHEIVALGITHVPQGDMIFPDMSVHDNLMMGAYLPEAYARAPQGLERVFDLLPRLAERRGQVASSLSGGERRMLSIGRGLMGVGRLMLIDEPSLGLAPLVIDQIYEVITDLKKEGLSLLLIEENASRAMDVGDSVHLLDDGQIVWSGRPEDMSSNEELLETYLGG